MTLYVQFNSNSSLFTSCNGSDPLTADTASPYWSSSQMKGISSFAWHVYFNVGGVNINNVSNPLLVRPVTEFKTP